MMMGLDPCHTGFLCCLFDSLGDCLADSGVKGVGENVIGVQLAFVDDGRERVGSGDLHLLIDVAGAAVERTAEDAREREHVVDLVREVASAGADNSSAGFLGEVGHDLGCGIRHRKGDSPSQR